jgi:hypothetical protein
MKNITLSADEHLIESARERARERQTTLNEEFRRWLEDYTRGEHQAAAAMAFVEETARYAHTGGRRLSRAELNER